MNSKFKIQNSKLKSGFTLIEMLVVISIITILGGLILGALSTARKRALIQRQEFAINTLAKSAIERYANDFHDFPDSGGKDGIEGCERLLEALTTTEKDGPYIKIGEIQTCDSNGNGLLEIADVWNQPLRYIHHKYYGRQGPNRREFRLYSVGIDGKDEPMFAESDDILNWKKGENAEE